MGASGAKPTRNADGETGLEQAIREADAVMEAIARENEIPNRIRQLIVDGEDTAQLEELRALLGQGANVNHAHELGFTALHFAALHSRLEAARVLIEAGADVRAEAAPEANRLTPGAIAEINGHTEIVERILTTAPEGDVAVIPVTLHIYDVGGSTQKVNKLFRPLGTGAFHAAVEVCGWEYSFGGTEEPMCGIFCCPPRACTMHTFRESIPMGATKLFGDDVMNLLQDMAPDWQGPSYDLLKKNCCHFSQAFAVQLGVGPLPKWVTNLAAAGATLDHGIRSAASATQRAAIVAAAAAGKIDPKYVAETVKMSADYNKRQLRALGKKFDPIATARMSADYNRRQLQSMLGKLHHKKKA